MKPGPDGDAEVGVQDRADVFGAYSVDVAHEHGRMLLPWSYGIDHYSINGTQSLIEPFKQVYFTFEGLAHPGLVEVVQASRQADHAQ
jgi:hypothetical protein